MVTLSRLQRKEVIVQMSEGGRRSSRTTKGKRQLDPSFVSSQELDGDDPQVQDEDDFDDGLLVFDFQTYRRKTKTKKVNEPNKIENRKSRFVTYF